MPEDEKTKQYPWSDYMASLRSKRSDFFRSSRTMLGHIATSTLVDIKQFLKRDVPIPSVEQLIGPTHTKKDPTHDQLVKDIYKLKKMINQSHEILASAQTALSPFPNKVVVDRTKITIIRRNLFWSTNNISIRIEDILNVSTGTGPLFGSLNIASRVMNSTDHFQVNFFWRHDAIHLKRIIQGYMITLHNNIDTGHLTREELIDTLLDLGSESETR